MKLFALYVHWPYCLSKCLYCDFASTVCDKIREEILLKRYQDDLRQIPSDRPLTSIYFGGGTPSLMSKPFFEALMNQITRRFSLAPDIEISLEANPDAIDRDKMRFFKAAGVNRFSLGVQSLNDKELRFLGRRHSVKTALQRIEEGAGVFANMNIDLIYGRPHQTCRSWQTELQRALAFQLPHYSLYQLTLEEKTPLFQMNPKMPTDEMLRRLYLLTDEIMQQAGRPAYEVSNYARRGYECRHNMTYWTGGNYAGIGPAACGRVNGYATENARTVDQWLKTPMTWEKLTADERKTEKILMGLRLRKKGFPGATLNPDGVQRAVKNYWLVEKGRFVYPTQEGILMLNQLLMLVT